MIDFFIAMFFSIHFNNNKNNASHEKRLPVLAFHRSSQAYSFSAWNIMGPSSWTSGIIVKRKSLQWMVMKQQIYETVK